MTAPQALHVDGMGSLQVHAIEGEEALSEAWAFDVHVTTSDTEELLHAALGKRAAVILSTGREAESRALYGVVAATRTERGSRAAADGARVRYVLRVVPRFWELKRRKRSRVFQRRSIPEIVASVLAEAGIGAVWQLLRAYPQREFCTQYEETDERFVRRLLAEAGIYFSFFSGPPSKSAKALEVLAEAASSAAKAGAIPEVSLSVQVYNVLPRLQTVWAYEHRSPMAGDPGKLAKTTSNWAILKWEEASRPRDAANAIVAASWKIRKGIYADASFSDSEGMSIIRFSDRWQKKPDDVKG
ncbi:MAG: contractile injection system protein, VgrG/Pvc8 family [Polyangiaceae bacterium]